MDAICNCLNCSRLVDHYWISALSHIIKCRDVSGQIETRSYHPLDNCWCPRWEPKACRGGCWSEDRNYIPGMRIATDKEWKK